MSKSVKPLIKITEQDHNAYKGKTNGVDGRAFEGMSCRGILSLRVLPQLTGKPWDEIALAFVHSLRPSRIRVIDNHTTQADIRLWRVTVFVNEAGIIEDIKQECDVGLPAGIVHGQALAHALVYGKDSEQVHWHRDAASYIQDSRGFGKYNKEGTYVPFPL